jgi:hypothetical protein
MSRRFFLLAGPPGAGKTTWTGAAIAAGLIPRDAAVTQTDELRGKPTDHLSLARITLAEQHPAIVWESPCPTAYERNELLSAARAAGYHTTLVWFDTDAEQATDRLRRATRHAVPTARAVASVAAWVERSETPAPGESHNLLVVEPQPGPQLFGRPDIVLQSLPAPPHTWQAIRLTANTHPTAAPKSQGSTRDKLVLLLVSGLRESAILKAAGKLGLTGDAAVAALAEARAQISAAAGIDRTVEAGTAYTRLQDLYRRALAVQDTKTALTAQRELNKLLNLYSTPLAPQTTTQDGTVAEIAAARAYLEPLNLGRPDDSLAELARLAVARIVELTASAK